MLKLIALGSSSMALSYSMTGCSNGKSKSFFPLSVASGDPKDTSVVLWTKIDDPWEVEENLDVVVEVSTDDSFEKIIIKRDLVAYALFDYAVKIKIKKLQADKYYYYRFIYSGNYSKIGRTKTAPANKQAKNVKFAYISCQDYIGRYYNTLAHLIEHDDLDFIVHLGDYIYETNGEPIGQIKRRKRQISFRDSDGVIKFDGYEAAKSLDNYRQLYQVYRADPILQKLHEKFPMIAIWDDHEFSDDNYGSSGNYFGGKVDENDLDRYRNSQRVYLEYMPIEVGLDSDGIMSPDSEVFVDDKKDVIIYRAFEFGSYLDLVFSDYRSYRSDHMISEDVFPATVFADEESMFEIEEDSIYQKHMGAYFNVETYRRGIHLQSLRTIVRIMYEAEGLDFDEASTRARSVIFGNLNAFYCNEIIKAYNKSILGLLAKERLIYTDDEELCSMKKGLAYIHMGKIDLFSKTGVGSRFMVVKDVYDLYTRLRRTSSNLDNVYGELQSEWISSTLKQSDAKWRIYASSVSMVPMIVDLSDTTEIDPLLRTKYYLNLDQFDGFREEKIELIGILRENPSVVISGDIHALFVADHKGVVEFTGSSVSSCTISEALPRYLKSSTIADRVENIETLLSNLNLNEYLMGGDKNGVHVKQADLYVNGYVIMEVSSNEIKSTIYSIDASKSLDNLYEKENLDKYFKKRQYVVNRANMEIADV